MQHYLLYDAHCPICSHLAGDIQQESSDRIEILPLSSSKAHQLLTLAYPKGYSHQPYLITETNTKLT